jgi:hypothetical protein
MAGNPPVQELLRWLGSSSHTRKSSLIGDNLARLRRYPARGVTMPYVCVLKFVAYVIRKSFDW